MKIRKVLPGALFLFLCLLCGAGIAGYFFRAEPQPALRQEEPRLVGIRDIVIGVGDTIPDLKEGLGVNDAVERVEIDTSAVDTGMAGKYPVIYRYTDVQGTTHEVETTCTVVAAEGKNIAQGQISGQQEKDRQVQETQEEAEQMEERKETVQKTTPPQTGDWNSFLKYAALFLASVFLCLFLFLRWYFFG
ncbi:hypothetical protein B5E53_04435 [Eubacterium sp. An11]|uniref:hypothetical protein n=1 Tax=Eubacterium sp. An11 TaxID=1965542 RepID=UPI000B38835A|nr:hypothetical protein [Eubacterium sp. An11]OUQ68781.1 hypothetical protein B5E53_04435 [Eubacterium sp. An11]